MAISQVPPLHWNVPIVDPKTGNPTPFFQQLIQQWLVEKADTDALADGAAVAGDIALSGLTTATSKILGRATAGTGAIEELTLSQALDLIGSAARGDILYRGSSGWARLGAGTSGQFLKTLGTGADPAWATVSSSSGSSRLYSAFTNAGITASTTEQTLQSYTLPGGTLATNGQAIRVTVRGKYANTTRSRQLRLYFGATVVTFMSSTAGSAFNIAQEALIIRTGATTQIAFGPSENAATSTTSIASRFIEFNDPSETLANDIVIKVTGQSGAGAVANDVTCDLFVVELMP